MTSFDEPLPYPLFEFALWPKPLPSSQVFPWWPVDIGIKVGGPLQIFFEQIKATGHYGICYYEKAVSEGASPTREHLQKILRELAPERVVIYGSSHPGPTLNYWLKTLFPKTFEAFGEIKLVGLAKNYLQQMPEASWNPWEGFRFWPGVLRKSGEIAIAQSIALEAARAQALFSPQDEVAEAKALQSQQLKLNPTLQFVKNDSGSELLVLLRAQNALIERPLKRQEALILDYLTEEVRLDLDVLKNHFNGQFNSEVEALVFEGVILSSVQQAISPKR